MKHASSLFSQIAKVAKGITSVRKFELSEDEAKMKGAPEGEIFTVELLERPDPTPGLGGDM